METLQEETSLDTVGERDIGNRISWRLVEIAPHAAPTCCYWRPPTHSLGAVSSAVVVHGAGVVVVLLNTAGGEGDWGMTNLCGMKYSTSGLSLNIGTATVLPSCPLPTSLTSSPFHEATPNGIVRVAGTPTETPVVRYLVSWSPWVAGRGTSEWRQWNADENVTGTECN